MSAKKDPSIPKKFPMSVKATQPGFFGATYINRDEIFTCPTEEEFAASWMQPADGAAVTVVPQPAPDKRRHLAALGGAAQRPAADTDIVI